jgi:TPP-dependent pyruvate/acetoin dehydrogenase alpha subunit
MAKESTSIEVTPVDFETFKNEVIEDFKLACLSREASLLGRREVLTGKAKFGIFGDGKELAQLALAKQFKNGDFRSGYYRDQTLMMAIGQLNINQYFAGLYGHTDVEIEPQSAGRQMGGHYSTRNLDSEGNWLDLMNQKNSSADISPTAGQMPRLLGLAQASKIYREHPTLKDLEAFKKFTNGGNEVAFGTIGDASTSEGPFWEVMNAAGVLQVPMVMSVWDDGYGITWDSTRIGPDLAASFAFEIDQTGGYTNGYPLTIVHTNTSNNQDIVESYEIQTTYPTDNSDLQAYIDIQDELNNLDPLLYPIFAKFKFNAILVDVNGNGVEDTCTKIIAVGREYSSSYDFKDVYFDSAGNGGAILPNSKVKYKAYNPKFNDIVLFKDHANISMLQHITMSYDKTNMPGIVSQTWAIINNTTNEIVTYQGQWLTYLFSERGDYTIQLTVLDCNGNVNTTKRNMISVVAPINAHPRKRPKYQYVAG